jgi:hypothetical protein
MLSGSEAMHTEMVLAVEVLPLSPPLLLPPLLSVLLPQAARDRAMARASASARIFFMFLFFLSGW